MHQTIPIARPGVVRMKTRETVISFASGGVTLHGTVFSPPRTGRRRPGIVLVSASGPARPREEFRTLVEPLTAAGIVTFVYDKRSEGYSITKRSYSQLADDALAALRSLRDQDDVDPAQVGLWGISEGGWVAPLAASRSTEVKFLILVAASGVEPARQTAWALENRLAADLGFFPEAKYDTVPVLRRIRQPVLAVWGAEDELVPPAESMSIVQQALDEGGNNHYMLKVFPNAGHPLSTSVDGDWTWIPASFVELAASWVNGLRSSATTINVGPIPCQAQLSKDVGPRSWYESPRALGAVPVSAALAFAGYCCAEIAWRDRHGLPLFWWPARTLVITGVLASLGLAGSIVMLLLTESVGPVVGGFALLFVALRALAIGDLSATIMLAITWWRRRRDVCGLERIGIGLLLARGAALAPWAIYWRLYASARVAHHRS
jgi:dienelactone hydrolase